MMLFFFKKLIAESFLLQALIVHGVAKLFMLQLIQVMVEVCVF